MKSSKIYLGLLVVSVSFLSNLAFAGDVITVTENDDLSLGKIEATEALSASSLAKSLSAKVTKKLNQDSTNSLALVIKIADKVEAIKVKISENPDEAYAALSTLDQALADINSIDLQAQEMGTSDSQVDRSSNNAYLALEEQISKVDVQ
jgi:hypothetical protein